MNIEEAKNEFINYTNKYDIENKSIARKIGHSLRVMEISTKIAENLNLSIEQIELATLIGLLHDIGRFEQMRICNAFDDFSKKIDHGDLGVEILEKNNYIRNFIQEDKYDGIILKAIKNHNKYAIEDGLTDEEMLFAKIIRDADKLDIFYEGVEMFWKEENEITQIEENILSEEIFNEFQEKHLIDRYKTKETIDKLLSFIAFTFDLNFKYSFEYLKEKDYINKIIQRFDFKHRETIEQFEKISKIVNQYIEDNMQ